MGNVTESHDVSELRGLIEAHVRATGSEFGKKILENFDEYLPKFKKIIPEDYRRIMAETVRLEEQGMSSEQARLEAFHLIQKA